jgi:polygalacturonase
MTPRSIVSIALAVSLLVTSTARLAAADARSYLTPVPDQVLAGAPFAMPAVTVPQIPDRSVSIADFGAVGDGKFLNTEAFARAIKQVAGQGGGRVVVPRGLWLTGPIILLDNIQLHTEAGALVLFTPDRTLYPMVETNFEGARRMRAQSPLSAQGVANIAITGEGVFDGSGQAWRPVKRGKLTADQWRDLVASGGVTDEKSGMWWPSPIGPAAGSSGARDGQRPVMISLRECRNVLLDGPTFRNSPAWNIHPLLCENLIVRNVTVLNPWYVQNGDGIDVDSCRNGVIYHCAFDVGDDAICIKSGKDAEGRQRGRPTENFVVRDCVVNHGHGGFTIGSEMSGGVRNMYVTGLTFFGTDIGLRFKSNRGRGGVVENIHISDINMIDIPTQPIDFNLFYAGEAPTEKPDGEPVDAAAYLKSFPPVSETTPAFRDITIRNVVCRGARTAMWIQGLPEMPVRNVRLENVAITARRGVRLIDVAGIRFDHVQIEATEGALFDLQNAQDLVVQASSAGRPGNGNGTEPIIVRVGGPLTKDVDLRGLVATTGLKLEGNVGPEAVKVPGK